MAAGLYSIYEKINDRRSNIYMHLCVHTSLGVYHILYYIPTLVWGQRRRSVVMIGDLAHGE